LFHFRDNAGGDFFIKRKAALAAALLVAVLAHLCPPARKKTHPTPEDSMVVKLGSVQTSQPDPVSGVGGALRPLGSLNEAGRT
jgi:hypothetical protein